MPKKMKFIVDFTREDYADFAKFHFRKKSLVKIIIFFVVFIALLQLYINRDGFSLNRTIYSSLAGAIAAFIMMYISLNNTKNIPKDDGTILGEKEMEFNEEGISYRMANAEGSQRWQSIKSLEESSKAFYLYMDTVMAIAVPKRVFKDKIEEAAFRDMVKQKIGNA
jgi:hypothetical protein